MKKPPKAWAPVPVPVQVAHHKAAAAAAAKSAAAAKAHPAAARARHQAAVKAAATRKKAKAHGKARKWSPDESVPCCSARAVAEALRIALGPVLSDEDVLALHWAAGGDQDAGASILDALRAAHETGLVSFYPAWVRPVRATAPVIRGIVPLDLETAVRMNSAMAIISGPEEYPVTGTAACEHPLNRHPCLAGIPASSPLGDYLPGQWGPPPFGSGLPWSDSNRRGPHARRPGTGAHATPGRTRCGLFGYASKPGPLTLLLGLDLPWGEPHAVVAHDGAWWSWGQPYDPAEFPGAVIEEAWLVNWKESR